MNKQFKAKTSSRIFAALIDFIVFYALMIIFTNFVITPIIQNTTDYNARYETYETTLLNTKIAIKDENNQLQYNFSLEKVDENDQILMDFYTAYSTSDNNGLETYIESKKKSEVFIYDEVNNTFTINSEVDNLTIQNFYLEEYDIALDFLYYNDLTYQEAYNAVSFYMNLSKYSGISISALIVFLVMPLILKNGKTLGKLIFKLSLSKSGDTLEKVSVSQVTIRFFAILVIEIIGSFIISGIPMFISLMMIMMSQKNFAIHDYLAKTFVVNDNVSDDFIPQEVVKNEAIEVEATEKEIVEEN